MMKMDQWVVIDTWWRWINVVSLVYDALLDWCKDESLLSYHGWGVQMDELQSGPLMVKSLTGRLFVFELSLKYGYAYMCNNEMKINVLSHSMSITTYPFTGNTKTRKIDDSTKLGFIVYIMNLWWKKVDVWVKFESRNPLISLRHANSLSMSNFNAFRNSLKTIQHWTHS